MRPSRLAMILTLLAACAAGRQEILSRTMAGVDAASKAFLAYDQHHQAELVDAAISRADGAAALFAYRAKRDKVAAAFIGAYSALAVASVDLSDASLTAAAHATAAMLAAMRNLGVL